MVSRENTIITIGSIALDTIHTKQGNRENILGGSASYFSLAATYFRNVSILGVVGNDFPQKYWDLYSQCNINTDNVEIKDGKTFQWGGKYSDDYDARETLFTELGVFQDYMPSINESLNNAKFIFLGNIHPDMQMAVIKRTHSKQMIILDTMNLWIDISLEALKKVISQTNIFLLNDEEAFLLTQTDIIEDAAEVLIDMGPEIIIIKKGSIGSYLYDKKNDIKVNIPSFPIDKVVDTTGAGDSFAGGFVGNIQNANMIDAVIAGSAIASFTVSAFGVDGLININKKELNNRINYIKSEIKD